MVKTTAYFTDIDEFPEIDEAYAACFDDGCPARDGVTGTGTRAFFHHRSESQV